MSYHTAYCLPLIDANLHQAKLFSRQDNHWLFDKLPGFSLWLNAAWITDCWIKWRNPFLAHTAPRAAEAWLCPTQSFGRSPFQITARMLELCQETPKPHWRIHRSVSSCSNPPWITAEWWKLTAATPLHLWTAHYQNVKIMAAAEKVGKRCQTLSVFALFLLCVHVGLNRSCRSPEGDKVLAENIYILWTKLFTCFESSRDQTEGIALVTLHFSDWCQSRTFYTQWQ